LGARVLDNVDVLVETLYFGVLGEGGDELALLTEVPL